MREILFRGERIDNGNWVEGMLFYYYDSFYEEYRLRIQNPKTKVNFEIDPKTICQYTGLVDRHNKKIFDGDIVRETITSYYQPVGKIYYDAENCQWRIEYVNNIVSFSSIGSGRSYELLGNIYDTPMLLENAECNDINESN